MMCSDFLSHITEFFFSYRQTDGICYTTGTRNLTGTIVASTTNCETIEKNTVQAKVREKITQSEGVYFSPNLAGIFRALSFQFFFWYLLQVIVGVIFIEIPDEQCMRSLYRY